MNSRVVQELLVLSVDSSREEREEKEADRQLNKKFVQPTRARDSCSTGRDPKSWPSELKITRVKFVEGKNLLKILKLPQQKSESEKREARREEKNHIIVIDFLVSTESEQEFYDSDSSQTEEREEPEDIRNIDFPATISHGAMSYVSPSFFMYIYFFFSILSLSFPMWYPPRKVNTRSRWLWKRTQSQRESSVRRSWMKHIFHEEIASFLCTCYVFVVSEAACEWDRREKEKVRELQADT